MTNKNCALNYVPVEEKKNQFVEVIKSFFIDIVNDMKKVFERDKKRTAKIMSFSRAISKIITPPIVGMITFAFAVTALSSISPDFATKYPTIVMCANNILTIMEKGLKAVLIFFDLCKGIVS